MAKRIIQRLAPREERLAAYNPAPLIPAAAVTGANGSGVAPQNPSVQPFQPGGFGFMPFMNLTAPYQQMPGLGDRGAGYNAGLPVPTMGRLYGDIYRGQRRPPGGGDAGFGLIGAQQPMRMSPYGNTSNFGVGGYPAPSGYPAPRSMRVPSKQVRGRHDPNYTAWQRAHPNWLATQQSRGNPLVEGIVQPGQTTGVWNAQQRNAAAAANPGMPFATPDANRRVIGWNWGQPIYSNRTPGARGVTR